ncbi:MAG: hypothetical protein Q6373_002925 [Candidatus Sigynarchaeota archaeon]
MEKVLWKKRRIKKDFDTAVAEGNDAKIEQLVKDNPWLQDYVDENGDETDVNVKRICAAIGIMEDERSAPATIDDIIESLRQDFNVNMSPAQVESVCMDLENKGYIKAQDAGYVLTVEGGRICDNYLNKQSSELLGDLPSE